MDICGHSFNSGDLNANVICTLRILVNLNLILTLALVVVLTLRITYIPVSKKAC